VEDIVDILDEMLTSDGFTTFRAANGQEAVDAYVASGVLDSTVNAAFPGPMRS
jgi:CheY-like chemotaxis protein